MCKKRKYLTETTLLFFISVCTIYGGRPDRAGTAAAPELLIPIGARSIAMGCSPIAIVSGIEAMYWNPAGLARSASTDVMISHMNYIADIKLGYLAVSSPLKDIGSFGISVKSLDIGEIAVTTEDEPDGTGEVTSPTFIIAGGTFSRLITDRISAGVAANYVYEKMGRVSADAFAFSLGVQYRGIGGIDGLSVGAAVKNIGSDLTFDGAGLLRDADVIDAAERNSRLKVDAANDPLPSTVEIGFGYTIALSAESKISISTLFQNNNYSDDEYKFGGEYSFNDFVSVRGGISVTPQTGGADYIFGPAIGAGFNTSLLHSVRLTFDYAYRKVEFFSGNHIFTIIMEI